MDWNTLILLIGALGGTGTIAALYKWAKAIGRAEALQEQSKRTILALKRRISAMKAHYENLIQDMNEEFDREQSRCEQTKQELQAENERLWRMVNARQERP